MDPLFIVFFSFKGGVGRSSSMLNASRFLAKKGKDVVIIDFDIAAPGIDIFEGTDLKMTKKEFKARECKPEDILKWKEKENKEIKQMGVTEFFLEGIHEIENNKKVKFPDINEYVYRYEKIKLEPEIRRELDLTEGKLYIFRAGCHESPGYSKKQKELDGKLGIINDKINNKDTDAELYSRMLEGFKRSIGELQPDYVLIDARPGLSSISIMAMQKLADVVVLCFNLNPWNFESIKLVYKNFAGSWKNDIVSEMQKIMLVVTPIPRYAFNYSSYLEQKESIKSDMAEAINSGKGELKPIQVPYNEQMTLKDSLIADDEVFKDDATYHAYDEIAELLIRINPEDINNKIRKANEGKSIQEIKKEFKRLIKRTAGTGKINIEVLQHYGQFLWNIGNYKEAINPLTEAIEISNELLNKPDKKDQVKYAGNSELYYLLGLAYYNISIENKLEFDNNKIEAQLEKSRLYLDKAINEGKKCDLAKVVQGDSFLLSSELNHKLEDLQNAKVCYEKCLLLEKDPEYYYKLGKINTIIAKKLSEYELIDKEKIICFRKEACNNFKQAVMRRTDYAEAFFNWGKNLYELSKIYVNDKPKEAKILEEANEQFEKAIDYKRDYAEAFYLYAISLNKMAGDVQYLIKKSESKEATAMLEAKQALKLSQSSGDRIDDISNACINFGSATIYKKDFSESYFFWGSALFILMNQSGISEKDKAIYFRDAFYKLEQAVSLFFDYPNFYFDPDEIAEISKNPFVCISTLESMFAGNKTYAKIKEIAEIPASYESLFEPQFKTWLNEEELSELERQEIIYGDYYEKIIIKSVFKKFMSEIQRQTFGKEEKLKPNLEKMEISDIIILVDDIVTNNPGDEIWSERKNNLYF